MSAQLKVASVKNVTTQVEIQSSRGTSLEVLDCTQNEIVLCAKSIAPAGQIVSLKGKLSFGRETLDFEATGKIESVIETAEGFFRFHLHLQQYDRALWTRFTAALKNGQKRADRIFASIRLED